MGGSIESYFSQETVESLRAEAAERLERGQIDADVNSLLQRELTILNDRDIEGINHLAILTSGQDEGRPRCRRPGSR